MEKLLDDQKIDKRQRDEGITGCGGAAGEESGRRRESKPCVESSTSRNICRAAAGLKLSSRLLNTSSASQTNMSITENIQISFLE